MKIKKFVLNEEVLSDDKVVRKNNKTSKDKIKKEETNEIKNFKTFEHHMVGRESQINYICDNINELSDNDIEYIYNHIEAKLGYSEESEY